MKKSEKLALILKSRLVLTILIMNVFTLVWVYAHNDEKLYKTFYEYVKGCIKDHFDD